MNAYWPYFLRGMLLLTSITLISYAVSTEGQHLWQSFVGGAAGMLSVTLQSLERRR